jgi:hypothetical protein
MIKMVMKVIRKIVTRGVTDGTSNQGSGDAGVTNLPILGTNGGGDNEIPNPSSYLNLDQHENEEDEGSAEHEGDVNEEDEAERALVCTLSASQVRHPKMTTSQKKTTSSQSNGTQVV